MWEEYRDPSGWEAELIEKREAERQLEMEADQAYEEYYEKELQEAYEEHLQEELDKLNT